MSEDVLKPCPFCGGKAEWHCFPLDYPNSQVRAYVQCNGCDAEISRDGRTCDSKKLVDSAKEAWNKVSGQGEINADLRAKLAAAQDWVNKQADMIDELEKQRDEAREGWQGSILNVEDLKDKLAAAEEEIDHLEIVVDSMVEVSRHMEVLKERDEYKAHNTLLVGALRKIKEAKSGTAVMAHIAFDALDTTPSETYEWVQGLVEALENIAAIQIDSKYDKANRPVLHDIVVQSRDALLRYRSVGNGERKATGE